MNLIISGKWIFLPSSDGSDRQRFRVTYIDPAGKCRRADAISSFSYDIASAMRMGS